MNYYLLEDPNDGPTSEILDIIIRLFPEAIHYTDADVLIQTLEHDYEATVLMLPQQEYQFGDNWKNVLNRIAPLTRQTVIFFNEMLQVSWSIENLCRSSNITIVTPGQHNFGPGAFRFVTWMHWLQDLLDVYKHPVIEPQLITIDPYTEKLFLFDALLGGERPYRTRLYNWIKQDPILSRKTILRYYGSPVDAPTFHIEPGITDYKTPSPMHTGAKVDYYGAKVRHSIVPPVSVYQQCAYSLITETAANDEYVFFTEKLAKPLVCRRLFIAIAGQHYLHFLRQQGFKTFHGVINESYDLEPHGPKRWRMAFLEMQKLAERDQQEVFEKIQPIVEHNKKVAMETDWHAKMARDVRSILDARLDFKPGDISMDGVNNRTPFAKARLPE